MQSKDRASVLDKSLNYLIALVWLINGLFCKILNLVPRHQLIVSHILGSDHAVLFTKVIGTLEVLMAIWVISKITARLCAITQIILVAVMNVIEFFAVPDLLLFHHINIIVATGFIALLYWKEFMLKKSLYSPSLT